MKIWHDGLQCLRMRSVLACLFLLLICDSKCTNMSTLQGNMPAWVGIVPYSHLVNKSWEYPTDCSGFVSWALQTKSTAGKNIKSYEYASSKWTSRIKTDDLRFGDLVTHVFNCKLGVASGHVFFFDKWISSNYTQFWAYESTDKSDQTQACLNQTGLTRSLCFNHHVIKERSTVDKWNKENCSTSLFGYITGGPKRLSSTLLCS